MTECQAERSLRLRDVALAVGDGQQNGHGYGYGHGHSRHACAHRGGARRRLAAAAGSQTGSLVSERCEMVQVVITKLRRQAAFAAWSVVDGASRCPQLSTGNQAIQANKFLPSGDALAVAQSLNLASSTGWNGWCEEGTCPRNVPSTPNRQGLQERANQRRQGGVWPSTDWALATGARRCSCGAFSEALAVAWSLMLASQTAWKVWCKEGMRPRNVPSNPNKISKDGRWQGWRHWRGAGNQATQAKEPLPFGKALAMAQSLGLASRFK